MAAVKLINYEGPNNILVWKSDITDFNIGTQLIVHESQEALFFKDGVALDLFGSGRHELQTNNLPLLRKIYEKLTNSPTTFHCEVYYVNKTVSEEMLWGTNTPIQLEDPKYGILIDVRAFGSYKVQIEDSRKFLIKTVGTIKQFNKESVQEYFKNEMISKVKVQLAKAIALSGISILEIVVHQEDIANIVKKSLFDVFEEYGLSLKQFIISNIKATDDDLKRLRKVKEDRVETIIGASSRKEAMNILGTDYREMETLDIMKEAAKNQAPGGLTGIGVGLGIAPTMTKTFSDNLNKVEETKACPKCNATNKKDAKFCLECGEKFVSNVCVCPKCGAQLSPNAKFCGECGERIQNSLVCPTCKTENQLGTKFCSNCGTKLG